MTILKIGCAIARFFVAAILRNPGVGNPFLASMSLAMSRTLAEIIQYLKQNGEAIATASRALGLTSNRRASW